MGSDGHGADDDFDRIAQMAPLGPPLGHHLLKRLLLDVWRLIPGHPEAHFGRPEVHFGVQRTKISNCLGAAWTVYRKPDSGAHSTKAANEWAQTADIFRCGMDSIHDTGF